MAVRRSFGELTIIVLLAVILLGATILAEPRIAAREGDELLPSLSVHSNRKDGARVLFLWFGELGYQTVSLEYRPFSLDDSQRVLFVLDPSDDLSVSDVNAIHRWVEHGGTLVVASDQPNRLVDSLSIGFSHSTSMLHDAVPGEPTFVSPPFATARLDTSATLELHDSAWVPLLVGQEANRPIIGAERILGGGRIFVLASARPLSNEGISVADNWALALYFLQGVPSGSTLVFDEYHHGLTERGALDALLVRRPWGWAIIYLTVLLFAYVALRGRRFGRAIVPAEISTRRTRAEYVTTLAAMLRQGRHAEWLRQNYLIQIKRAIGAPLGVRSDLPAQEFIAAITARRARARDLTRALDRLERAEAIDESTVVDLMLQLDTARERLVASTD